MVNCPWFCGHVLTSLRHLLSLPWKHVANEWWHAFSAYWTYIAAVDYLWIFCHSKYVENRNVMLYKRCFAEVGWTDFQPGNWKQWQLLLLIWSSGVRSVFLNQGKNVTSVSGRPAEVFPHCFLNCLCFIWASFKEWWFLLLVLLGTCML